MKRRSALKSRRADPFLADVQAGLQRPPRSIPPKYFYDERGSDLFERICALPEYYLTRAELQIMERHAGAMAELIGPRALLVEFGSGSGRKTRLLMRQLQEPVAYVPVDLARPQLLATAHDFAVEFPTVEVLPLCADFTRNLTFPAPQEAARRLAVYFPGSTIGNFEPDEARLLLRRIRGWIGRRGCLLIGVDLEKDVDLLERAYNDRAGVTAEFNRNVLVRINRELSADFDPGAFIHHAFYDTEHGRIEMHLVSLRAQEVTIAGECIRIGAGETIHTENSYKYTDDGFRRLVQSAGMEVRGEWTDAERHFAVFALGASKFPSLVRRRRSGAWRNSPLSWLVETEE